MITTTPLMVEEVNGLYRSARDLSRDEVKACYVIRLPDVTPAGQCAAGAVIRSHSALYITAGRVVGHAARILRVSRLHRVLGALAQWLRGGGAPGWAQDQERWFGGRIIRPIAETSAGARRRPKLPGPCPCGADDLN